MTDFKKRFIRNAALVGLVIALVMWRRANHAGFAGMSAGEAMIAVGGIVALGLLGAALAAAVELRQARRRGKKG